MNDNDTILALNPSQLRNLRNWKPSELPSHTQTLVLPLRSPATVPEAVAALTELVRAHQGLRSRLATDPRGHPVQRVLSPDNAETSLAADLSVVDLSEVDHDPHTLWDPVPVPPDRSALKAVCHVRDGTVVALKLSLSHVFVDALGKQAAARHLRQLLDGDPAARSPAPQAGDFAKPPGHPEVRRNTAYWTGLLAAAPRSLTYGTGRREETEPVQTVEVPLDTDESARLAATCRSLRITPHVAWVAALSAVVGQLTGRHRQVFKATYANRLAPADFCAVAQLAQPVFPLLEGDADDTLRERVERTARALAPAARHSTYDANSLLDRLNSGEHHRGALFQPAFEVNYVPTVDPRVADALYGPARARVRTAPARIDLRAAKPELSLTVRHRPDPLLVLAARRPVHSLRDGGLILDHCRLFLDRLRDDPDAAVSALPVPPLPGRERLLAGHPSGVAVHPGATRHLVESAPGVRSCTIEPGRGPQGDLRLRAVVRVAEGTDPARLRTHLRQHQPGFPGSVVPDELVLQP